MNQARDSIRVTVCQIPPGGNELEAVWPELCKHTSGQGSDLVLLPEMPFHEWLAGDRDVDADRWAEAVESHSRWCSRLGELGVAVVVGSRPVATPGRHNRAFVWTKDGLRDLHDKVFLPEEEGFWEASWYQRGEPDYRVSTVNVAGREVRFGVLLCTEMWFLEHARAYGRAGADLLLVPRATPISTLEKWRSGGRAAAVVSGAYCLSASCVESRDDDLALGGGSWVVDPDGLELAMTSTAEPFATLEIDLDRARHAKGTYPRYVPEAGD